MRRSCGLVGRSFYHVSSPGSMSGSGRMSPLYAAQKSTSAFIALIFSFCVPVSLCPCVLRPWVRRGQPVVRCRGWAAQPCQRKQVSVGAAAARPKAVHGENDIWPLLRLCSTPSQKGFVLSGIWEGGALSPAYSAGAVSAHFSHTLSSFSLSAQPPLWYQLQQSWGSTLSEAPLQNFDEYLSGISTVWCRGRGTAFTSWVCVVCTVHVIGWC